MSNLMKTAEEFLSVRFRESDYGVLAVGLLHHPFLALEKKNASSLIDIFLIISDVKKISSNLILGKTMSLVKIFIGSNRLWGTNTPRSLFHKRSRC